MRIAVAGGVSTGARQALDILHVDGEMPVLDKESIIYKMYNKPEAVAGIKAYFGHRAAEILKDPAETVKDAIDRQKLKRKIIESGNSDMMLDIENITGPVVSNVIDAFHRRYKDTTTAVETPGLLEYDVVHNHTEKFGEKFNPIVLLFCDPEQQKVNCFNMIKKKMSENNYKIDEIYRWIDILLAHELPNEEKMRRALKRGDHMIDTTNMSSEQLRREIHAFMKKYDIPIKKHLEN